MSAASHQPQLPTTLQAAWWTVMSLVLGHEHARFACESFPIRQSAHLMAVRAPVASTCLAINTHTDYTVPHYTSYNVNMSAASHQSNNFILQSAWWSAPHLKGLQCWLDHVEAAVALSIYKQGYQARQQLRDMWPQIIPQ